METRDGVHAFEVQVYLDDVYADAVRVELLCRCSLRRPAHLGKRCSAGMRCFGAQGGYAYSASVPATRPASDYTPRVVPFKAGAWCRWRRARSYGSDEI